MKTIEEIETLKREWHSDPCWDIENTDGFEDHLAGLREYRLECEAAWAVAAEERKKAKAEKMGVDPESELFTYLCKLEARIEEMKPFSTKPRPSCAACPPTWARRRWKAA